MTELFSRFCDGSYEARALVVLAALGSIALWDFRRNGRAATRWREYAFWLVCAGVGAIFGVANDAITSRVSPAYFVVGKGLTDDPERLPAAVACLAAKAGAFAGLVIGGVFLLANNPSRELPQLRYRELARDLVVPALGAILVAIALVAFSSWDVQGLEPELRQILAEHDVRGFLAVQRGHAGLYIGGLIATGATAAWIRIARRKLMVDGVPDTRAAVRHDSAAT